MAVAMISVRTKDHNSQKRKKFAIAAAISGVRIDALLAVYLTPM